MPDLADSTPDYLRLVLPDADPADYATPSPAPPAATDEPATGDAPASDAPEVTVRGDGRSDGPADVHSDAGVTVPGDAEVTVQGDADPLVMTAPGTAPAPSDHIVRVVREWMSVAKAEAAARWDRKGSIYTDPPETIKAFIGYHLACPWLPDDDLPHPVAQIEGQAVGFGILLPLFLLFSGARWCVGRQLRAVVPVVVLVVILFAAGVL